ncbi:MAG: hypothetical protein PHI35_04655 [Victivallaceae bacterium]|nr:hypothetical protein [Victivallaceae bacterium]
MAEKIKLEICCGTTCFMLGAAEIMQLATNMPPDLDGHVEVTGLACMNACLNENLGHSPFVRIDGKLIGNATVEMVCDELRKRLNGGGDNE